MKIRTLSFLLAAAVTLTAFSACGTEGNDLNKNIGGDKNSGNIEANTERQNFFDGIFSVNYKSSESLNPFKTKSSENMEIAPLMYEGLFKVNGSFDYENVLCESFSASSGTVFRLAVKKNIKMHDGTELTAADVAYSINLACASGTYAARLSIITAAYTLEDEVYIELSRPNYGLPLLLDFPIVKNGSGSLDIPVGSGPYYYVNAGEYCYLKAFEQYRSFDTLPLDRLYLAEYSGAELVSAFDLGLVDIACGSKADINYLEFGGNTETRYVDSTEFYYLGVNASSGFLADKSRRILLSSFINRDELSQNIINGVAVTVPLNPASSLYSESYDPFTIKPADLTAAQGKYMVEDYDEDGELEYLDPDIGAPDKFTLRMIVSRENPVKLEIARSIRDSLVEAGFNVELSEMSWNSYIFALRNRSYDLYCASVMLTADFDLTSLLSYGGSANYGVYDSTLQTHIYNFNAAPAGERQSAASELYGYIAENLPVISLMFERRTVYTHRQTVTGLEPIVHNIYNNIENWTIDPAGT